MTRRLQLCRSCKPEPPGQSRFPLRRGFTRHKDRRCSRCRRYGPPAPSIDYRGRAA